MTTQYPFENVPPVRITTDGEYLYCETNPEFLRAIAETIEQNPCEAPMLPHSSSKIGNVVMAAGIIGFSEEAIDLIQRSTVIPGDLAYVSAWESIKGPTFSWLGFSSMALPANKLTITQKTKEFDFSKFCTIPNETPNFSNWLDLLSLSSYENLQE
ncbi:MAG: hypothetical protein SNJ57_09375 [Cyanobacteriota bacterium]